MEKAKRELPRAKFRRGVRELISQLRTERLYPPDTALISLLESVLDENERLEKLLYERPACIDCAYYQEAHRIPSNKIYAPLPPR